MKIKSRRIYVKKNGRLERYMPSTNRRFFANLRACPRATKRIIVRYSDADYQVPPLNDSGWYTRTAELLKTARIFCEG